MIESDLIPNNKPATRPLPSNYIQQMKHPVLK
jgi:hypothetical protein